MTLALVIVAMPAHSVLINDLYVAEVVTVSQSDAQRRRDAATGLRDVLVRVSGRVDVVEHPLVAAALRSPEDYYTEFSYQTVENDGMMPNCLPPLHRRPPLRRKCRLIRAQLDFGSAQTGRLARLGQQSAIGALLGARGSGAERAVLGEGSSGLFANL